MDNYNQDAKTYENMVRTKQIYEQTGNLDDEVYIRACEYLSTHQKPEDIYNKAREPLKIDIKDPPNGPSIH